MSHFRAKIKLFQKFFKKIVCSKRSLFFKIFLCLWYYESYGFAIFVVLSTIRLYDCIYDKETFVKFFLIEPKNKS